MKTIDAHELKQRLQRDNGTMVIDVLPKDHFEAEHVPGSINIPLGASRFVEAVEGVAEDKQQPLVVYCANHDCDLSPKAAERLEEAGFENVTDFDGGIEEWKREGYEVTTG